MEYKIGKVLEEVRSLLWNLDTFLLEVEPTEKNVVKINRLHDERKKLKAKVDELLK